jgi:hypothetical protein
MTSRGDLRTLRPDAGAPVDDMMHSATAKPTVSEFVHDPG